MNVQLNEKIEISSEVLSQEVGCETVLLDLESESYFGLDATGTRIWQLIQKHKNVSDVFVQMLQEFDVDEETLRKDLKEHLDILHKAGLIKLSRSGA
jgi:hypothetical protein